jgi:hypothetical protein
MFFFWVKFRCYPVSEAQNLMHSLGIHGNVITQRMSGAMQKEMVKLCGLRKHSF